MLQKRIDQNSIPYGLAIAGEDIVKGRAVVVKVGTGVYAGQLVALYPTTQAEADSPKGFATFRIETAEGSDKSHDVIKAGSRVVIYTLAKDNIWGTTEVNGTPAKETKLVVGFTDATDKGKLRVLSGAEVTAGRKALVEVFEVQSAGSGYTDAMFDVAIL